MYRGCSHFVARAVSGFWRVRSAQHETGLQLRHVRLGSNCWGEEQIYERFGLRWGKAMAAIAVLSIPSVAVFAATGDQPEEVASPRRGGTEPPRSAYCRTAFTAETIQ
jgi:hypothetical protein